MPRIRISYNAPVVLTFALLAVGVFILNSVVSHDIIRTWFTAKPVLYRTGDYLGLITHILGHANWEHLLGNFMLILLVGPILEERHGSTTLLGMILVTALVTGLINLAFFGTGLLGASGIVFMMILLASTANIRQGEIPLTFIAVAVIYLGGEIVRAVRERGQDLADGPPDRRRGRRGVRLPRREGPPRARRGEGRQAARRRAPGAEADREVALSAERPGYTKKSGSSVARRIDRVLGRGRSCPRPRAPRRR